MEKNIFDYAGGRKYVGMILLSVIAVIYVFKGFMDAQTSLFFLTPLWLGYGTLNILSKIFTPKEQTTIQVVQEEKKEEETL